MYSKYGFGDDGGEQPDETVANAQGLFESSPAPQYQDNEDDQLTMQNYFQ